jgi:hypothetical protein
MEFIALAPQTVNDYSELSVTIISQVAATCSLWFLARGFFYREDEGDTFLRNVGSYKIYTAPHPTFYK